MKGIYTKIAKAKKAIKETKLKKAGLNTFSNYHYFTPEQIEQLVFDACEANGLLTKFDLHRNEIGTYGTLEIIEIETSEKVVYTMATAIPEIKATNIAQQLGGCVTYTERYLKQTAFGISENSLDFDSHDNTPKSTKKAEQTDDKPWLNLFNKDGSETKTFKGIQAKLVDGETITLTTLQKHYKISKKTAEELDTNFNIK
jgi:hypothetical protein